MSGFVAYLLVLAGCLALALGLYFSLRAVKLV